MEKFYHIPVLLKESLENLDIKENGVYVDVTCGEGGHSEAILEKLDGKGYLICIDRDKKILEIAKKRLSKFKNVSFYNLRFDDIKLALQQENIKQVDGIIADLGISMFHLKELERGISYTDELSLDMRLDDLEELTAFDVVNKFRENEIADILYRFGEEREARKIAREILSSRPIKNAKGLADLIARVKKERTRNIHPATKSFQALRIFVNKELKILESFIPICADILSENGRLVVISYHSLEDRIVKWGLKELEKEGKGIVCTKKVILPSMEEIRKNKSARSAKMRVFKKVSGVKNE
ncbi:MAG: 16S rRNA (cytosine(1402)-N(4))-methyltransferase RsmH [Brevinematales bacterium]|nr:16S rRNA (cytosine(1402)-N(4))-methyltransferase RsmH [Brevinematales bacterium]